MLSLVKQFAGEEQGTVSIEFVLLFPIFFGFFLMTYEAGVYGTRQVSLEHGVDVAVREVRLGNITLADPVSPPDPAADIAEKEAFELRLRTEICNNARVLPDCLNQIRVEVIQRDMSGAWTPLPNTISCINRISVTKPDPDRLQVVGSNELGFIRACIRIDPFIPTSNLGKAFVNTSSAEGDGSYALFATSAIVIEPREDS